MRCTSSFCRHAALQKHLGEAEGEVENAGRMGGRGPGSHRDTHAGLGVQGGGQICLLPMDREPALPQRDGRTVNTSAGTIPLGKGRQD